jgi:hypothetical protein
MPATRPRERRCRQRHQSEMLAEATSDRPRRTGPPAELTREEAARQQAVLDARGRRLRPDQTRGSGERSPATQSESRRASRHSASPRSSRSHARAQREPQRRPSVEETGAAMPESSTSRTGSRGSRAAHHVRARRRQADPSLRPRGRRRDAAGESIVYSSRPAPTARGSRESQLVSGPPGSRPSDLHARASCLRSAPTARAHAASPRVSRGWRASRLEPELFGQPGSRIVDVVPVSSRSSCTPDHRPQPARRPPTPGLPKRDRLVGSGRGPEDATTAASSVTGSHGPKVAPARRNPDPPIDSPRRELPKASQRR